MWLALASLAALALGVLASACASQASATSQAPANDTRSAELPSKPQEEQDPRLGEQESEPDIAPRDVDLSRERQLVEEARAALTAMDLATARAKGGKAIDALLLRQGGESDADWLELVDAAGHVAWEAEASRAARVAWEKVLEVRSRTLSGDHHDLQAARANLALTLKALGDFPASRALFEQALEACSRTLPGDHPYLQAVRLNLALTIKAVGDLPAARTLFEQVLEIRSRTLPDDHPNLQVARMGLAATLCELGDLPAARVLQEQVLEVFSRTLPDAHPDVQVARQNLALTLKQLGDYAGASVLFEQVLEVRSRTLPDDDPALQTARQNLAATICELGDLHGARALFEQVLEVRSRTLPEDHSDLQTVRGNLAVILGQLGDLHAALALQDQVLEVLSRTLPEDDPNLQAARGNLAVTTMALGNLVGARALQQQVLEALTRKLPDTHPEVVKAQSNLAATIFELGDLQGARALLGRVLEVRARELPDDHLDLQKARTNLAVVLSELGDLHGALALEERVLESLTRTLPDDHPNLQAARGNLAETIKSLGDLTRARALGEQVLEVFSRTLPQEHPDLQVARLNLALTIQALGDLNGARDLALKAFEVFSRTLPDDHHRLQSTRLILAATTGALGDLESARALEEKALEVFTRTLPDDHPDIQMARNNLGETLFELGDLQGTRALQEQVLEACSRTFSDDHPILAHARHNLALTLAELEDHQEFLRVSNDFVSGLRLAYTSVFFTRSPREVEAFIADEHHHLSMVMDFSARDPALEQGTFELLETVRAAGLVPAALLSAARGDSRLEALREATCHAADEIARSVQSKAGRDALTLAVARRDAAQRDLLNVLREAGRTLVVSPRLGALSACLSADEVCVSYWRLTEWGEGGVAREHLNAYVVGPDTLLHRIELGPIEPIEQAAAEWRAALGVSMGRGVGVAPVEYSAARVREQGVAFRRLIFDPLLPALGDGRHLVVALDDVLHAVPLDALPAAEGLLGEHHRIEQRLSLRDLLWKRTPPEGEAILLAIGAAAFNAVPLPLEAEESAALERESQPVRAVASILRGGAWEEGFEPLTQTGLEARGVAALFTETFEERGRTLVLEGRKASREALEARSSKARYVHVATHGWYAPGSIRSWSDPEPRDTVVGTYAMSREELLQGASPMVLCGLALAGANLPADALGRYPGLVTAEEIASWDLSNCELAVLSACDTNVGIRRAGQGVASLQKALHMAGARSVITSLWKVPDEATKDLMLDFYRRLWVEKKPKWQALWEAKMKLRNAKDEQGRPSYSTRDWAAWVLTGEPD